MAELGDPRRSYTTSEEETLGPIGEQLQNNVNTLHSSMLVNKENKKVLSQVGDSLQIGLTFKPLDPPALPPKKSVTGKITKGHSLLLPDSIMLYICYII